MNRTEVIVVFFLTVLSTPSVSYRSGVQCSAVDVLFGPLSNGIV